MLKEAYSGVSTKITFSYSNQRFCTETVMNRTKKWIEKLVDF